MWNCCAPQFTMTWCVVPSWRCSHRQQSIARIYIHIRGWEFAQFCFRRCSELHAIYIYANLRECVGRWNAIWYVILVLSLTASLVFVSYGISEGEDDRQNLIIKFYAFDDDAHTVRFSVDFFIFSMCIFTFVQQQFEGDIAAQTWHIWIYNECIGNVYSIQYNRMMIHFFRWTWKHKQLQIFKSNSMLLSLISKAHMSNGRKCRNIIHIHPVHAKRGLWSSTSRNFDRCTSVRVVRRFPFHRSYHYWLAGSPLPKNQSR